MTHAELSRLVDDDLHELQEKVAAEIAKSNPRMTGRIAHAAAYARIRNRHAIINHPRHLQGTE